MSARRIGIDLGGTKIEGIVMNGAREVLHRRRVATPRVGVEPDPSSASADATAPTASDPGRRTAPPSTADEEYAAILESIDHLVEALESAAGARCRVGVGTPGTRTRAGGVMKNCNTTSLNGRPLQSDLSERLGREVRLANDANCFAISEAIDGAARGHRVVFGVILGTGVGGGVVLDGRVHEGPNGTAGEWGHVVLEADGPLCYCGKCGCVETFLSGPGLVADHARAGGDAADPGSGQLSARPGAPLAAPEIVARARGGDAAAAASLERYLDRFGRAIALLASTLDPDCIVLGGGMSAIDELYTRGREAARRHAFGGELDTPIVRNAHGDASGVRGAAMLWPDA